MTHNSNSDALESEKSGSVAASTHSKESLTLHLRLESKRKAHALALASKRSIAQVIEELIEKCPEGAS
jgi:hypothetical protein